MNLGLIVVVLFLIALREVGMPDKVTLLGVVGVVVSVVVIWLTAIIQSRRRRLRAVLSANVDDMDGAQFEECVKCLLQRQGYRVRLTGRSGDLGVDLIARRADRYYAVQVKRQRQSVSRRAVSDAVAGKVHYGCNAAMVVTNSYFTKGAQILADSTGCELVDRDKLARWIDQARRQ